MLTRARVASELVGYVALRFGSTLRREEKKEAEKQETEQVTQNLFLQRLLIPVNKNIVGSLCVAICFGTMTVIAILKL